MIRDLFTLIAVILIVIIVTIGGFVIGIMYSKGTLPESISHIIQKGIHFVSGQTEELQNASGAPTADIAPAKQIDIPPTALPSTEAYRPSNESPKTIPLSREVYRVDENGRLESKLKSEDQIAVPLPPALQ